MTKEDACEALTALVDVAFIFAHVFKRINKGIIDLLWAIIWSRLVVEVDDIQSEKLLVNWPLVLRLYG